ncbi:13231_t:CDS:2, partial [Gigaspora margarita]
IQEERKKWKLAINTSFTVLSILVTIAINAVAKIFNNDEYINNFVLILNCIVFGIQTFTIISVPVNEGIFDDKTWTRVMWILIPTIIGILLAIFLGIYVLPASVTISWIVVVGGMKKVPKKIASNTHKIIEIKFNIKILVIVIELNIINRVCIPKTEQLRDKIS